MSIVNTWNCIKLLVAVALCLCVALNVIFLWKNAESGISGQIDSRAFSYMEESITRFHGYIGLNSDGTPAYIPTQPPPEDMNMARTLRHNGGFNIPLSDSLPLDRKILDARHPNCHQQVKEAENSILKPASVVIVFHDEPFSTLLRSVHSVLNLTPPHLLREIVLIDDKSTHSDIKLKEEGGNGRLEGYVRLLPKVRLVRSPERKGIVDARLRGIKAAISEIFVILDSHIEVQPGWIEPLLMRITMHKNYIVMPQVDGMDAETLQHVKGGIGCKLGFLWKLMEHSYEFHQMDRLPNQEKVDPIDFQSSPTMAGGLFAADKEFFLSIGGYDPGFQYWGAENLEFSFRLWMCGGVLECSPCSRVYHMFRKGGANYSVGRNSLTINKMRVLMWMDEYADLAYKVLGSPIVDYDKESLMERALWRKEKKCKSFKWYMENVYPESDVVHIPNDVPYLGPLRNVGLNKCIDHGSGSSPGDTPKLFDCHGLESQDYMYFRKIGHVMPIYNDEACITPSATFDWCRGHNEHWWEFNDIGQLVNKAKKTCLGGKHGSLVVEVCNPNLDTQKWIWSKYNPPKEFVYPPTS